MKKVDEVANKMTWSEQFDFDILCRVKGLPGLWLPATNVMKNGMICMVEFLGDVKKVINCRNLVVLSHLEFHTMGGSKIKIGELKRAVK